jgi:hypothetical protein
LQARPKEESLMANASTDFLEELGRRKHLPLLEQIKGKLRFDLIEGQETDSWLVVVDNGNVRVSRGRQDADCVIYAERVFFDSPGMSVDVFRNHGARS